MTFAQKPPVLSLGEVIPELNQLLELIQPNPGLSVTELVSQRGKSVQTIERRLEQFKGSQHIEFRGTPKTGATALETYEQHQDETAFSHFQANLAGR